MQGLFTGAWAWHGAESRGQSFHVPGCLRSNLTVWKEDRSTVLSGRGIVDREKRAAEWITKALPQAKPGSWGCGQARAV